ncbi:acetyl-CoA synthetase-like protein [Tothia fuscella]|uniref:Acetyl-CoA synthetase-like protein n=1 Tax=Tothia fuscella TaxID=1048955 RepID=A0A9P4U3U4_9PEZI|nr:acetyl-CoA synthetase-like protein [Tothia fuscella]
MDFITWTFSSGAPDLDKPLLIDPSDTTKSLSYNGLRSQVRRLLSGLQAVGVSPGDCVCVNSFNDVFYTTLYLGIIGSGAIFTAVNPSYTSQELIHHFRLTKPKILIVEPHLIGATLNAASDVAIPDSSIYLFDVVKENHNAGGQLNLQSWETLLTYGERDWIVPDAVTKTVAVYSQTSGTTGLPKAALIPHSYLVSQAALRLTGNSLPYTPRRLTALPPFHAFAAPILPSSIREGIVTYVMRRFDMRSFIEHTAQFEISETFLPPPVLVGLPLSPFSSKENLKTLRQILFGGASLRYSNQVPLYEILHSDASIQPVWGMTEIGWISAGVWPEKHVDDSVGRMLPGFEIKVLKGDGSTLAEEGESGDIFVRSPDMMLGYLDNEDATREAFDQDGWLRTGDVGRVTGEHKVFIDDRRKDLLKVRGWQVSPAEIEAILLQHPEIVDAGVIGVPLANGTGDLPRAYVVLQPESKLSPDEIKAFASASLAKYKVPEEIVFIDSIPRNPTGKILRRELREKAVASIGPEPSPISVQEGSARGPLKYIQIPPHNPIMGPKHM